MENLRRRCFAKWGCAASCVLLGADRNASAQVGQAFHPDPIPLSVLRELSFSIQPLNGRIGAYTVNSPPLGGFTPQMVVGLTNEENHSDSVEGMGTKSGSPGGIALPTTGSPYYVVATLDSGSQADIFTYADTQIFNFPAANRDGSKTQAVEGVNGTEDLAITDAVGVYATDFSNASVSSGAIGVNAGTLRGQWDVPVLTANPEDQLPNVLGSPILSQYRVTIQNSQPKHLTVGATTYRTPNVTLSDFSTSLPTGYSKLTLKTTDAGPPDAPYYFNFDFSGPDNPDSPGAWTSLITNGGVSLTNKGATTNNQAFLLDTGAQLSLISNDTAASIGIFNASPENADFTVDALGVGGIQKVPGYYINALNLTTQGGILSWAHVPVLVLDVADPRDPSSAVPGILGTNLFGERDLILNTNVDATGQTYLGIGPQWKWGINGSGSWSNSANWSVTLPNGIDTQANFFDSITSAATITVDGGGFTVGSIAFDNTNRYTINGPGTITLDVSVDHAQINVNSGSHTINATMTLNDDTDVNVVQSTSTLTVTSDVNAGTHGLFKMGSGVLEMKNVRAGALEIDGGKVTVLANGAAAGASKIAGLTVAAGATLDLTNNAMAIVYAPGASPASDIRGLLQSGYASGSWTGAGIVSANAQAVASDSANLHKTAIGFAEASSIGSPATWFGQNVDATSILMRYTFAGDANLDGTVGSGDFTRLAQSFNTTGAIWSEGDFNFDGVVNALDFSILASNFGQVMPTPALGSLVPEPGAIALLALGCGILRRKRHLV